MGICEMSVFPDFGAVGGAEALREIIGALMMFVLVMAVLVMVVSGVAWALATANGHVQFASRARMGLWVACGTAVLAGASVALVDFLLGVGSGL
jgi:Ni/Fe-hydrogenase subunit HybB-like protein